MNLPFFIAQRLAFTGEKSFSLFITKIAIAAVALSVCVMILGTAITQGYQKEIRDKFVAAWGQYHITQFLPDPNGLMNDEKFEISQGFMDSVRNIPDVEAIYPYSLQSAILKSGSGMEGIVMKGISEVEHLHAFKPFMQQGHFTLKQDSSGYSKSVCISSSLADRLNVKLKDALLLYMVDKDNFQPRARKVIVEGIFSTGVEDFDKHFILADHRLIQQFHHESTALIQGYEVHLKGDQANPKLAQKLDDLLVAPRTLYTIEQRFSNIFSWLGMMKTNEQIIISIMMIIAFINMITALLILILERTRMIGVLKTLGMQALAIKKIFLYSSSFIVGSGVLIGLSTGLFLCWIQKQFHLIKLDESSYFIQYVPIYLKPEIIFGIVLATIVLCLLLLLIPAILVNKINPAKAVRFQ